MGSDDRHARDLFAPARVGALSVANRIVMAPMTRARALSGDVPGPLQTRYYAQRASAGIIITEGIAISHGGRGYYRTPGLYTDEQIAGWRAVTEAVHDAAGHIYAQLWHVGRISNPAMLPPGIEPVAPSPIQAASAVYAPDGFLPCTTPRELSAADIEDVIEEFSAAARNALAAGFDGVQIHAGNGYLPDQFLRDGSNERDDEYGGSIENRVRFLIETTQAVTSVCDADRVSVRISPLTAVNDMFDSDPEPLFVHLVERLNPFGLAFLDVVEGATAGPRDVGGFDVQHLRQAYRGLYMGNNGYSREMAIEAVRDGLVDLVGFGRAYIANPDLVDRLRSDHPLATDDRQAYYGGGEEGYTDYPAFRMSA